MAKPCSLPHCYKSETAAALLAKVQLREQDALRAAPRAGAARVWGFPPAVALREGGLTPT